MTRLTSVMKPLGQRVARLARDRAGSISVMAALSLTALIGFAGLGTEASFWYVKKQQMQGAADAASYSAAAAIAAGETVASGTPAAAAKAIAAQYGYVDGSNGVTVTVNSPPLAGPNAGNTSAVEVLVDQQQSRLFSALFMSADPTIAGRAVSLLTSGGTAPCVIALNTGNVNDLTVNGTPTLNIPNCDLWVNSNKSNGSLTLSGTAQINANSTHVVGGITVSGGAQLNDSNGTYANTGSPRADPFAGDSFSMPAGCDATNYSPPGNTTTTINPGVYCGGISVNAGATLHLNPGVYYMNGGTGSNNSGFTVNGGGTVTGDGVTIVLTGSGSNYATVQINGNSTVTLNETANGPIGGLAFFQDRNAPVTPALPTPTTQNTFNGGTTMNINGGIYFPNQLVTYTGGATSGGAECTQLVSYTIKITGNTNFQGNCQSVTGAMDGGGTTTVALVE
jgi:Putative Flp pilus-assembly TadE/G-like